jgi:diguanylate cyclase (GGDEF)-like protein
LNNDGSLYGIVTQSDILSNIDPDTLMERYRLIDFLKIKKRDRWVNKEMLTSEIFKIMEEHSHDAVIIVEDKKPIGIVTTKDILRLLKKKVDVDQPIKKYMVSPVVTISQQYTLRKAFQIIQNRNFKRIVTVDEKGCLAGSINQKELISVAYTRWIQMINSYQTELKKMNESLERKSKKYEKIAAIDPLTGLYNRMKFLTLFAAEYTVMVQRQNTLSILLIDLDHFKLINDRYGHNMGDKVLKQIANLLLKELRSVDIVCRWGGEEFVILLPAVDENEAIKVAEKIRYAVEVLELNDIPNVTTSIGVSGVKTGDTLYSVIERADKALYRAKVSGRNRIEKAS